jgi:hypothetical protein
MTAQRTCTVHGQRSTRHCHRTVAEYIHNLFHLGTSKAPTGSGTSYAGSVQVPTGLKLIFLCLLAGLASLLHGSYSSMVVTRWLIDMMDDAPCSSVPLSWKGKKNALRQSLWIGPEEARGEQPGDVAWFWPGCEELAVLGRQ